MKHVAQLLKEHAQDYRIRVHEEFFLRMPQARAIFALSLSHAHPALVDALASFLEGCDQFGAPQPSTLEQLDFIGQDHRRHGFPSSAYAEFSECLKAGLDLFELSASDRIACEYAFDHAANALASAADAADLAGIAPAHQATVVAVDLPNREYGIVRLETGMPIDYEPGQYVPVTCRHTPGQWCHLAPAGPANSTGELLFHVQVSGADARAADALSALRRSEVGDTWTLGVARGEPARADERVVFVCFDAHWAAARAALLAEVDRAVASDEPPRLECTVFVIATSPGQHCDLRTQHNLRQLGADIRLLVRQEEDPWLLGAKEDGGLDMGFIHADAPVDYVATHCPPGVPVRVFGTSEQQKQVAARLKAKP